MAPISAPLGSPSIRAAYALGQGGPAAAEGREPLSADRREAGGAGAAAKVGQARAGGRADGRADGRAGGRDDGGDDGAAAGASASVVVQISPEARARLAEDRRLRAEQEAQPQPQPQPQPLASARPGAWADAARTAPLA